MVEPVEKNETRTGYQDSANMLDWVESFPISTLAGAMVSGYLWIVAPFYFLYLMSKYTKPLTYSWRMQLKMFIAAMQLKLCLLEVFAAAPDKDVYFGSGIIGPMFQAVTLVIVILSMELERRKGCVTSGFLFIYWFLATIANILGFCSDYSLQHTDLPVDIKDMKNVATFFFKFSLTPLQLVLSCMAEPVAIPEGSKPCPEMHASFLSKLTFWWANGLVNQGYKKTLSEADVFELNPSEQSKTVVTRFETQWNQEKRAVKRKFAVGTNSQQNDSSPPLLGKSKKTVGQEKKGKKTVSLWKVLAKTFWWEILVLQVYYLTCDILGYITPFLLSSLIAFTEDTSMPSWKGYVLALGFFCTLMLQLIFGNKRWYTIVVTGRRIRAILVSSIFRKSIKMNNQARTQSTVGQILNMIAVDVTNIRSVMQFLWAIWASPFDICLSMYFLYQTVGVAMFAGFSVMLILIPINAWMIRKKHTQEELQMKHSNHRIKLVTEILNGIKILKLYAWELAFRDKVNGIREEELKTMRKTSLLSLAMHLSWTVAPFVMGAITFSVYLMVSDEHRLDASTAFVALSLFNSLQSGMNILPMIISELLKAGVSMKRVNTFLNHDEIDFDAVSHDTSDGYPITVKHGTFSWDEKLGPCLRNINFAIPEGKLVAVVGQVGAGKSSLLSAILGEMEKNTGTVNIDGTSAYVSQQAWIQNATLRDNILFGSEMKRDKYDAVIEACALKPDFEILAGKDLTEIGEKGINLSGGQKQRVSLARAVYFDSDMYLLDDPLSAVDSHTGKHIFEKVIGNNGLLRNKTRILVTHGIRWLSGSDLIIVMSNGAVSEMGSYKQLMNHDGPFAQFLMTYSAEQSDSADSGNSDDSLSDGSESYHDNEVAVTEVLPNSMNEENYTAHKIRETTVRRRFSQKRAISTSGAKKDFKVEEGNNSAEIEKDSKRDLIEKEDLQVGEVDWAVLGSYAKAFGLKSALILLLLVITHQVVVVLSDVWLSKWTGNADLQNMTTLPGDSPKRQELNNYYLHIYCICGILQGVFIFAYSAQNIMGTYHASVHLHKNLLTNVLRGPMSFFDTTPVGRIVHRFSNDISVMDDALPNQLLRCLCATFTCASTFIVITYSTPVFLTVILPLCFLYYHVQSFYIRTQLQLKRLESHTNSPIYSHFSECLAGTEIIRAFNVQDRFAEEAEKRMDRNNKLKFAIFVVHRWLFTRLEMLGALSVLAAGIFAVASRTYITGAIVGLSITYALRICDNLNSLVYIITELDTNIVSVERIKQYTERKTEAPVVTSHKPEPTWPDQGKVELKYLSLRYREGLDLVLKRITVAVKPVEKVGIVGRTGAGKSSLSLSLFRLVEPAEGKIIVDGEDITNLGLHDLRSRITVLPQDPVIFSGSLRMNLDPLNRHTNEEIWVALEHVHLKSFVESLPTGLDHECGEGGQNLSVGQKQLMCLARSLLRKTKILVLDEATAAVDMETDGLIQQTINREFKDCTVLTIAHRLSTIIDYDRILVLDKGKVKEFDSPKVLLQKRDSIFYSMARDAGLV